MQFLKNGLPGQYSLSVTESYPMQASWIIDKGKITLWRSLVEKNRDKDLPKRRRAKNVRRVDVDLGPDEIWRVLVGCQVTTQQRSGPGSAVDRFLKSNSPVLNVSNCRQAVSIQALAEQELRKAGLRRAPTIAENISTIFSNLETGGWKELRDHLATIEKNTNARKERAVVDYLTAGSYPGLGQKQSRNFIQWLGLSRYEVPLDSRVLKKLKELGSNFVPSGSSLTDKVVYIFVQDVIQCIAKELNIYPCELDACIFASFDSDE